MATPKQKFCVPCQKSFSAKNWSKHMNSSAHGGNQRFSCDDCQASYSRKQDLKAHVMSKHTNLQPLPKQRRIEEVATSANQAPSTAGMRPAAAGAAAAAAAARGAASAQEPMEVGDVVPVTEQDMPIESGYVPDIALAGPSRPEIGDVFLYEWYQEPREIIPRDIYNDILPILPEGSKQEVFNNWDVFHSYINERDNWHQAYCYRLIGSDQKDPRDYFDWVFDRQQNAFKVKASLNLLLKHKTNKTFKFLYASNNNFNLQVPDQETTGYFVVHNENTKDKFKQALSPASLRELSETAPQSTEWKVARVLGIRFWTVKINNRPMGAPIPCPDYLMRNKFLKMYRQDRHHNYYQDNLCIFRFVEDCLTDGDGFPDKQAVLQRFTSFCYKYGFENDAKKFPGVDFHMLDKVEDFFKIRISVYQMNEEKKIQLLRRAAEFEGRPLFYAHVHQVDNGYHVSRILDLEKMGSVFFCPFCNQEYSRSDNLNKHIRQKQCNRGKTQFTHPGGTYSGARSVFMQLEEVGIQCDEEQYYPYRAVFDFESLLVPLQIEGETEKRHFLNEHRPVAFCIVSNIPDYDEPYTIINGDCKQLIKDFMGYLAEISGAARILVSEQYAAPMAQLQAMLEEAKNECKEEKRLWEENHDTKLRGTPAGIWCNKLQRLKSQFQSWINRLPILAFNGGRYDLKLIREHLYNELLEGEEFRASGAGFDERMVKLLELQKRQYAEDEEEEPGENRELRTGDLPSVIKQGSSIMCLTTKHFIILDMCRYTAPGCSLDKFLKAWSKHDQISMEKGLPVEFGIIESTKIPFPYGFLDDVSKLDFEGVPPKDAFWDHLHLKGISDENYAFIVQLYQEKGFKTMKDYLAYYVYLDCQPFLLAASKNFKLFWDVTGIDTYKEAISLPGLTLKYLERKSENFHFGLFSTNDGDLHDSMRAGLCGGLSVVNHRRAVVGETPIHRNPEFICKNIMGLDFNSLYLAAMAKDMPCGHYDHWVLQEQAKYGPCFQKDNYTKQRMATEWLVYKALSMEVEIIHAERNGYEKRVGPRSLPVDGLCVASKIVFEFLGCWWHMHVPNQCKGRNVNQVNPQTKRSVTECNEELAERKRYMESLGYSFVYIWECDWIEERKQNDVQVILDQSTNKVFNSRRYIKYHQMQLAIEDSSMFGFCLVDLHTPEHLKPFFSEFPPIIKHAEVGFDDIGEHMQAYCEKIGEMKRPRQTLIGSYKGERQWMLTPLLKYLIDHGVVLDKIHEVVQYERGVCFDWFRDTVSKKRAEADADPMMGIMAECWKLLGNTGYGKTLTALDRHKTVKLYPSSLMREVVNDPFLEDVEYVGGVYEVTMRPRKKKMNLPLQVGLAVYQWAKLYMMEFMWDVLGKLADPRKWMMMESDTDSIYLAMATDTFDGLIKPECVPEYNRIKSKYFVLEAKDKRTPGLLKEEFSNGHRMICLCSKTYIVENAEEVKISSKGLMKRRNNFDFDQYDAVLQSQQSGSGTNVGFMLVGGTMRTYEQHRSGLSYLYYKRRVLDDGISTVPLDI